MSIAGAGAGAGFGGARWSPDALFAGGAVAGAWADLDAPGAITRNTQPDNTNSDFSVWTGVNPDATPTGWGKIPTPGTAGNHIEQAGNACRLVSDGTSTYIAKTGVTGNYYTINVNITALVAGQLKEMAAAAFTFTSTGSKTASWVLSGSAMTLGRNSGVTDGTFTSTTFENKSVNAVTCKGTLGNLAQATASLMPYEAVLGSRISTYLELADFSVLGTTKSTQRFFHAMTGATACCVFRTTSTAASIGLFATAVTAGEVGMLVYVNTSGALIARVCNGTGVYHAIAQSANGTILANTTYVVRVVQSASALSVYVNGTLVATDTVFDGVPSAADPTYLMCIGNMYSTNGVNGHLLDPYVVAKAVSASEGAQLDRYFGAKHGVTIA